MHFFRIVQTIYEFGNLSFERGKKLVHSMFFWTIQIFFQQQQKYSNLIAIKKTILFFNFIIGVTTIRNTKQQGTQEE